jgi:hypothetical protein
MSERAWWALFIGGAIVGWYALGAVFRVLMKDSAKATISSNFMWGCSAMIYIGTFLTLLYVVVRFIKWAWD